MKLSNKLTLFVTLSKLATVLLFVLALPYVVDYIASRYTDNVLQQQRAKVLKMVARHGVGFYLEGQQSYGSYTMLREEFIALEPTGNSVKVDTIETAKRIIEPDTLNYRILSYTFRSGNQNYLLEIAKATTAISQYSKPLQLFAFYALLSLLLLTVIFDLMVTHYLIKPLGIIIKEKLVNQKFPFTRNQHPVKSTTSDFRYLDASLTRLMDQINEAFEKEREFTANASHELMTPISILQNKIENLMEHTEVTGLVQQRLAEMMRTLNRLKKIVNSLLLISRIENEQFSKADVINIKLLVEDIMDEISHRLEEKKITFKTSFGHHIAIENVNYDLIFQLFYNLVNNAIKYNKPGGSILISDGYEKGIYSIRVKDTGLGIPADDLPFIFNRFKKSNLSESGGYGLGLSIVKSIANYHDLKLEVTSAINMGTTIKVIFPKPDIKK